MLEQSPIMTEVPKNEVLSMIYQTHQMTTKVLSNNDMTKDNSLTLLKEKATPLFQPFFAGNKCYSAPDKKLHKKVTIKEPFVQKVILIESYKDANYMMTYNNYGDDSKKDNNKLSHCPCKYCIIM